ncbi:MAG TPA: ferritin [Longimicrobiales bacterium]|nr:ferritin [Longimicrobiales bacterium]
MDKAIQDALNEQINAELHSAYTYWAMSAHFSENNFEGFAHWMRRQAQEEMEHATKLYDYVLERGGHVVLTAVAAPPKKFGTPLQIFQTALGHEKKITALIHALYELARKKKDFATENHLNWFVTEQVEEEDNAGRAVEQLKRAGDNMSALLMLDGRFGARAD